MDDLTAGMKGYSLLVSTDITLKHTRVHAHNPRTHLQKVRQCLAPHTLQAVGEGAAPPRSRHAAAPVGRAPRALVGAQRRAMCCQWQEYTLDHCHDTNN